MYSAPFYFLFHLFLSILLLRRNWEIALFSTLYHIDTKLKFNRSSTDIDSYYDSKLRLLKEREKEKDTLLRKNTICQKPCNSHPSAKANNNLLDLFKVGMYKTKGSTTKGFTNNEKIHPTVVRKITPHQSCKKVR